MKKLLFPLLLFLYGFQAHAQIPETPQHMFSFEGEWMITTHTSFNGDAVDTIGNVFAIVLCFPDSREFAIMTGNDYGNDSVDTKWFPVTSEEYGCGASVKCVSGDSAELVIDDKHGEMDVRVSYISQKRPVIYRYNGVFHVEDDED